MTTYNGLKGWPSKQAGSKPTEAMLDTAHTFGRVGKQSLAFAMTLRPEGATDGQQKAACITLWGNSGSHHNHRRKLEASGYFKRDMTRAHNEAGHTVYAYTLTPKGEAKAAKLTAARAEATLPTGDKPKGKKAKAKAAKPRKRKAAEVTAPQGEGDAAAEVPAVTAEAPQGDAAVNQPQT